MKPTRLMPIPVLSEDLDVSTRPASRAAISWFSPRPRPTPARDTSEA